MKKRWREHRRATINEIFGILWSAMPGDTYAAMLPGNQYFYLE